MRLVREKTLTSEKLEQTHKRLEVLKEEKCLDDKKLRETQASHKTELAAVTSEKEKAEGQVSELEANLEELKSELEEAAASLEKAKESHEEILQCTRVAHENEVSTLTSAQEETKKQADELESSLNKLKVEFEEAVSSHKNAKRLAEEAAREARTTNEAEVRELTIKKQECEDQVRILGQQVKQLQIDLDEAVTWRESVEPKVETLTNLLEEKKELEAEFLDLQQKYAESEASVQKYDAQQQKNQQSIEGLFSLLSSLFEFILVLIMGHVLSMLFLTAARMS